MKFNRPFTPGFLKRWDEKLLLNQPDTWSARAHLIIYYCLLFMAALAVICFMAPNDPRLRSNVFIWVTFVSLLAFVGIIVWLIYLLRFNVFKRYGNVHSIDHLKTYLLYFLSVGALVLTTFIPSVVETIRSNRAYPSAEIVSDVNALNTMVLQLEHNSVPHRWTRDSFIVVNELKHEAAPKYNDNGDEVTTYEETTNGAIVKLRIIDTVEFNIKYEFADSLVKINDSMYVNYECPDYVFVSANDAPTYVRIEQFTSAELYRRVLQHYHPVDKLKTLQAIKNIVKKYDPELRDWMSEDNDQQPEQYISKIKYKYDLYAASNSIDNITGRKYRWDESTIKGSFRLFYYITLFIALLTFMFRRTSVRTFFLTLLSLLLLSILTSLFFAFMQGNEVASYTTFFVYYIIFLISAVVIGSGRVRNVFAGIVLNLTLLMTPLVPLMCVTYYYAILYQIYKNRIYAYDVYKRQYMYIPYAEIAGFVLLLLMIAFFFSKRYRLWFAQPEQ